MITDLEKREYLQYPDTRVLIVDDVKISPMALAKTLRRFGCRLDCANNGNEALEKMKTQKFDLIFMDCYMPEMDGFETTDAIRKGDHSILGDPVIIALTGNTMNADRDKCLRAGMNDFLPKPFNLDKLEQLLEKWAK